MAPLRNRFWTAVTGCAIVLLAACMSVPTYAQQAAPDATAPDSTKAPADTVQADTARADTVRVDTVQADTVTTDSTRADTVKSDAVRADTVRTDTVRADTVGVDTVATDTVGTGADVPEAPSKPFEPVEFLSPGLGSTVLDTLSAMRREPDVPSLLGRKESAFFYDIGPEGFPHSVSLLGLPPQLSSFWYDGRTYSGIVSGRPRYDLIPLAQLEPLRTGADLGGQPNAVYAEPQVDLGATPLTQIRYRRDSNGLSRGDVFHSQKREFDLFGEPGVLGVQFGFSGATANGEYGTGTALDLYRGFFIRADYRRNEWGVRVSNESIRHRVGAPDGVLPGLSVFESIYIRPIAQVRNAQAGRQTVRNDLTVGARGPLVPGLPNAQASLTWTSDTFDYDTGSAAPDTTWFVKTNALHGMLRQPLRLGVHRLTLDARAQVQQRAAGNTLPTGGGRYEMHAAVRDSVRITGLDWTLDAGVHSTETQPLYPSLGAKAERTILGTSLFASVRATGDRSSWMETSGFEGYVRPIDDLPTSVTLIAEAGLRRNLGPFELGIRGYAHEMRNPVDLYALTRPNPAASGTVRTIAATDSVEVLAADGGFRQVGVTADLGWRTRTQRGFYARVTATAHEFLNDTETILHARVSRTLPQIHGRGLVGARFLLFQDLVFNAQVEGRGWTTMSSRMLHAPTGSLVVPPLEAPDEAFAAKPVPVPTFGPDGVLDVNIDIDLYGATLFFTFENVLGGTEADLGTFIVPTYPLPDQQFRFGVFWPIFD